MIDRIERQLKLLKSSEVVKSGEYIKAEQLYRRGNCQVLTHAKQSWEVLIAGDKEEDADVKIKTEGAEWYYMRDGKPALWDCYGISALMQIKEELENTMPVMRVEGKAYTRDGLSFRLIENGYR